MFALLKPTFSLRPLQLALVLHSKAERSHSFSRAISPVHLRCSIRENLLALGSSGISPNHNSSADSSTLVGLWYTKDSGFELTGFSDADYAGYKDTFKSTSGGAQFLGEKLVSWSLKKQDCTALLTAEAEYVSLSACCA
nr:retrotransposon protein, putative, Ty1-copia subclass [Tanacetum cinerariifolium]